MVLFSIYKLNLTFKATKPLLTTIEMMTSRKVAKNFNQNFELKSVIFYSQCLC